VCCDVWEPWQQANPFKAGALQETTRIVFQIDIENSETGKPLEVSQMYSLSLHEKSKLCQHLEAWRGRKFTQKEKEGFDLENLIGANCQVQVVHNIKDGGEIYANIQAIVPLGKGMEKMRVSDDFTRKKDRPEQHSNEPDDTEQEPTDGDVPF
jgi:hypothetical protein